MSADGSLELSRQLRPLLTRVYQMVRRRSPGWDISAAQSSVLTTLMDRGPLSRWVGALIEGVRMPTATSVWWPGWSSSDWWNGPPTRRTAGRCWWGSRHGGAPRSAKLVAERNTRFAELLARLSDEERRLLRAALPAMAHLVALDIAPEDPADTEL